VTTQYLFVCLFYFNLVFCLIESLQTNREKYDVKLDLKQSSMELQPNCVKYRQSVQSTLR